jgi:hypothetical protein
MVWRGAGGQVYIVMLRRRIDRGLAGGAADEPIFGSFAVMINESDWTRAPVHAESPSLVGSGLRCRIIYTIGEWRTLRSIGKSQLISGGTQ